MRNKKTADYTLIIKSDTGYKSTEEGRCSVEQYSQALSALHGEALKRTPLKEEEIIQATEHIDTSRSGYFIHIARAIEAAHGIKE